MPDDYGAGKTALRELLLHSDKHWQSDPRHPVRDEFKTLGIRAMTIHDLDACCRKEPPSIVIPDKVPVVLPVPEPDQEMLLTMATEWSFTDTGQKTVRFHLWRLMAPGQPQHVSMHLDAANKKPDKLNKRMYNFAHLQFTQRYPAGSTHQGHALLKDWAPQELPRLPVLGDQLAGLLASLSYSLYGTSDPVSRQIYKAADEAKEAHLIAPVKS